MSKRNKNKQLRKNEPPVSLHPLNPEDALRAFMKVDPEKVKERERKVEEQRRKTGKKRPPKKG